jgi:hypothetical protein
VIMISCPGCGRSKKLDKRPRGTLTCINCGAKGGVGTRKAWAVRQPEKDGLELDDARIRTFLGLLWLAQAQKYKPGWAAVKYQALFGEPPWWWNEHAPESEPPSVALLNWCIRDRAKRAAMLKRIVTERNQEGRLRG